MLRRRRKKELLVELQSEVDNLKFQIRLDISNKGTDDGISALECFELNLKSLL